jgi:flagellar basal-body rod protein FlgB
LFNDLFDNVNLIQKGLDVSWLRNKVTANNIANADTPGFKASKVEFETEMKKAIESGQSGLLSGMGGISGVVSSVKPEVVEDDSTIFNANGNNVDIDKENVNMAKNTLYYNELVEQVSSEFSRLNTAIKG